MWPRSAPQPCTIGIALSPLVEVVGTFLGIYEGKESFGDLQEDPQCSGWSTRQVCCCPVMGGMSGGWRKADANGKPRGVTKDSSQNAQSSLRSEELLVLDLKAKNPQNSVTSWVWQVWILQVYPGPCLWYPRFGLKAVGADSAEELHWGGGHLCMQEPTGRSASLWEEGGWCSWIHSGMADRPSHFASARCESEPVCRDQLLLYPGDTAQTLIFPAEKNPTIIWSIVIFVLDSFPLMLRKLFCCSGSMEDIEHSDSSGKGIL